MRTALLQLTSGDDPEANLIATLAAMREAAAQGAGFILTPEVTNCLSASRAHQRAVLHHEDYDPTLAGLRDAARELGVWLLIGSLAVKTLDEDARFANRSYLIDPKGKINARYDKMHMFDVQVSDSETYRESAGYRPGTRAVVAQTPFAKLGLSICYDVRFSYLYRALAHSGAQVLCVPAAFSRVTGAAHWEVLLRARAIETGCYVLAPAQCGENSKGRATWGHSMVVAPWGEVLADGGDDPCIVYTDIDLAAVESARARVPALSHDRAFEGPLG